MSRAPYAQRLARDVAELFSHNFNCSSSSLTVLQTSDSLQARGSLLIKISIFEGPYRGGCYLFSLCIPESYPFRSVEIYATQPIWHPNIDLFTGKVALPLEWSPVLTLNSLALAVQMLLLEPSAENPLNMEAYSLYISQSDTFEQLVQKSISGGCTISGIKFSSVLFSGQEAFNNCMQTSPDVKMASPLIVQSAHSDHHYRPPTPFRFERGVSEELGSDTLGSPASGRLVGIGGGNSLTTAMEGCDQSPLRAPTTTVFSRPIPLPAPSLLVASLSTSAGSGDDRDRDGRGIALGRKRHFDHTESSMELDSLTRQEAHLAEGFVSVSGSMGGPPNLVRVSSMEEWNQRISMAYSQLSLSASVTTGVTTANGSFGGGAVGYGSGTGNALLRPTALPYGERMLQSVGSGVDGMNGSNGPIGSGSSSSVGSMRSASSCMDVCSPHKKVKFCLSES